MQNISSSELEDFYEFYLNHFNNWFEEFKGDGNTEKSNYEDEDERIERIACAAWMHVVKTYLKEK